MIDIFDFIDSKDIREYNKQQGTEFTPIEQAAIIYHSTNRSVEEKIVAWKGLLDKYSSMEFESPKIRSRSFLNFERTFNSVTEDTVKDFETALEQRNHTNGVIYSATLYECEYPETRTYCYFSNYDKAFQSIRNNKQFYLETDDIYDVRTAAEIIKIKLDCTDKNEDIQFILISE